MKKDLNPGGSTTGELVTLVEDISLAGGANKSLTGWNKSAPVRARVLDFWVIQKAAGPAASSTLTLRHGDGAGTETFTAISDSLAIGTVADKTMVRAGTLDDAQYVIEKGDSLNISAVASAGTHSARAVVLLQVLAD